MKYLAAAVVLTLASPAAAQPVYEQEARADYVAGALDAIGSLSDQSLANTYQYIYVVNRNQCQAPTQSLVVACLVEAARRSCKQSDEAARDACQRASDVMVTNRLSEKQFLPRRVRFQIMNANTSYRRAMVAELRRRYAALVTEMTMTHLPTGAVGDRRALATAVEAYCRDSAATRDLSWQHCAAAIVWFIATSGRDVREGGAP